MENEENEELEVEKNISNNNAEYNKKANILCIISLLLVSYVPSLTGSVNGYWLCKVIAFILMVYVRIKYPKNKFGKYIMIFYITTIILYIVFISMLVNGLQSCQG